MRRKWLVMGVGLVIASAAVTLGWLVLPENPLGVIVIFAGLAYCLGGSLFLALGRQALAANPSADRTLLYLAPGALLVLLGAPLEYHFTAEVLPRGGAMLWLGSATLLLGFLLRIWTRKALKGAYQGNLQVQPRQQLITGGPYRWVRHPGYLGFIGMALGLAIGFSSLAGLVGAILLAIGFLLRVQVEERLLIEAFGDLYLLYTKRTGRMLPRYRYLAGKPPAERRVK